MTNELGTFVATAQRAGAGFTTMGTIMRRSKIKVLAALSSALVGPALAQVPSNVI